MNVVALGIGIIKMNIATYHSEDAPTHKSWLAHMDLGTCHMDFFADTKLKAVEKAERFFAAEKARQIQIVGNIQAEIAVNNDTTGVNPWAATGRGQGFAGKVWMLNRATQERARVEANQVSAYEAKGYVRGGPRSK